MPSRRLGKGLKGWVCSFVGVMAFGMLHQGIPAPIRPVTPWYRTGVPAVLHGERVFLVIDAEGSVRRVLVGPMAAKSLLSAEPAVAIVAFSVSHCQIEATAV